MRLGFLEIDRSEGFGSCLVGKRLCLLNPKHDLFIADDYQILLKTLMNIHTVIFRSEVVNKISNF